MHVERILMIKGQVRLKQSKIGCLIGNTFVGALAYADDITLLAPTPAAMRYMLRICEECGREFCVSFNAAKSASIYCGKNLLVVLTV